MALATNVLLVVLVALSLAVAVRAYANRPARGAASLAAFMLTLVAWQGSHLAAHVAPASVGWVFLRTQWVGIGTVSFVWFVFVLAYTGRESLLTPWTLALTFAWPVGLNAAIWLSTAGVGPAGVWTALHEAETTLFWAHVALSYAVFGVGTLLLVAFLWRSRATFRLQAAAVLAGVAAMWAGSLVSLLEPFGDLHLHATIVGMTAAGVGFLWATARGGFTDLVPVATSTVLRTLDAGVVVLDRNDRLVEFNPVAAELLDLDDPERTVGATLDAALADHPDLRAALADLDDEGTTTLPLGDRRVQVRTSRLRDGDAGGRVVLLGDVTEQRRRQERLERQNERLDAFAGVVSHDLRNPLMVAEGYVDQAIESGDLDHLERVQDAHERMDELVGDLLALAREGESVENPRPVEFGAAARRAWDGVGTADADLRVEDDLALLADPGQLERLLENLFRNAVKHGATDASPDSDAPLGAGETIGDGGTGVSVWAGATGEAGFFVADDGPGIPEAERDRVFESGFSTGGDGAGLGLAIVESVAAAHGWDVTVTESEAGGARFEVTGVEVQE